MGLVYLPLCNVIQIILHFSAPTIIISMFNKLFWWNKSQPWVPSFRDLQSHWVLVTGWNNVLVIIGAASIFARIYNRAPMLCSLSRGPVAPNLSSYCPCEVSVRNICPYKMIQRHLDVFVVPPDSWGSAQCHQHIGISCFTPTSDNPLGDHMFPYTDSYNAYRFPIAYPRGYEGLLAVAWAEHAV